MAMLPPEQAWDEAYWRAVSFGRSGSTMARVYECLGLVASIKQGAPHPFRHTLVRDLSRETLQLASRIRRAFDSETRTHAVTQLIRAAAHGSSFDQDINALLDKYGEHIWGQGIVDREHLRRPNVDSLYTKELIWERDADL
ncbi:hypothetical protein FB567DRAFT_331862 [Paraphoma chrysanthemicola]|uniref:Uncharacterized protein n=1 Tax=Paraphoma chrysanthemicola TaxID=798071 RepID=A0A8K0R7D1_9PLEO|nr:hypothetical protein FB567DRAFT_331862 [Paraphoma chrysanthemicola]